MSAMSMDSDGFYRFAPSEAPSVAESVAASADGSVDLEAMMQSMEEDSDNVLDSSAEMPAYDDLEECAKSPMKRIVVLRKPAAVLKKPARKTDDSVIKHGRFPSESFKQIQMFNSMERSYIQILNEDGKWSFLFAAVFIYALKYNMVEQCDQHTSF